MAGEDFIVGLAVNLHPEVEASLSVEQLQEIVAWHDERALADYVTCGTGSYFDFAGLIPTVFFADKLGAPYAEALKAVTKHMKVQAESHIRTPENAEYVVASGQADMVSIVRGQIADPHLGQQGQGGSARGHPPVPVLQPDVLGPALSRLLDLLPHQSLRRPRVGVGRRPVHPRRGTQAGAGGGRRAGRAGSRAGGRRTRAIR